MIWTCTTYLWVVSLALNLSSCICINLWASTSIHFTSASPGFRVVTLKLTSLQGSELLYTVWITDFKHTPFINTGPIVHVCQLYKEVHHAACSDSVQSCVTSQTVGNLEDLKFLVDVVGLG